MLSARNRVNAPVRINETKANGLHVSNSASVRNRYGFVNVLAPEVGEKAEAGYHEESWKSNAIESPQDDTECEYRTC